MLMDIADDAKKAFLTKLPQICYGAPSVHISNTPTGVPPTSRASAVVAPVDPCRKLLLQQGMVAAYERIEAERLGYLRCARYKLGLDLYWGVQDPVLEANIVFPSVTSPMSFPTALATGPSSTPQRPTFLSATFSIPRPHVVFITFGCDPLWPEIVVGLSLYPCLSLEEFRDAIVRTNKGHLRISLQLRHVKKPT